MTSHHKSVRSRFSSPLRSSSPSGHNRGLASNEGQRTFLQRWLEPPVQNKASFQEAGLMRGGVVENMAPLGTLPKAAMHKKSPINGEGLPTPPVKTRIVLKKPFVAAAAAARESAPRVREESVEEVEPEEIDSVTETATEVATEVAAGAAADAAVNVDETVDAVTVSPLSQPVAAVQVVDDAEDDDYVPKKSKARLPGNIITPNNNTRRHSARRRSARPSPTPINSSPILHTISSSLSPHFRPPPSTFDRDPDKDLADRVVEAAVDEALRHYRYPTAWALRLLYDDNSSDPHFVSMIEDIYYQRADPNTLKEFHRLVCDKKREGKKDNKGCYYFVPPSTGSRFTPHNPKPAPYEALVTMDLSNFHDGSGEGHINKKVKLDEDSIENRGTPSNANRANHHKGGTNSKSQHKASKGGKTRSESVSSSSELSSVPDDVPDDYEEYMDQVDDGLGVARPIAAEPEPNNAQIPAGSTQPISGQKKKPAAAKKKSASPKHPSSQNTTRNHLPSRDSSMPAALVANGTPHHLHLQRPQPNSAFKFTSRFGDLGNSDQLAQKKLSKKLETSTNTKEASEDSFIREPLPLDDDSFDLAVPPPPPTLGPNRLSRTPALSSRAARAAKRNHDDLDDSISPTALSFRADLEPSSARNSRAATPSNLRSSKKPRAGLRVKTSPMKKKGTSAGIPRSSGDRPSPIGNGPPNQDENDDSCFTCGGNGELVCCDGCSCSFHFLCIDPPLDQDHMPDEWYCNECKHRFSPPFGEHEGVFRSLLTTLDGKNPRAFRLTEDVRDLFEGVRTGLEGEYEEAGAPKPKVTKKSSEEPLDFFRVRNADGTAALCHRCHLSSAGQRPIIPCSVCGLNWHLECLDPPMAVPPVPRTWRCPCHVDDMLSGLPARLAPAHRYRKIKNVPVIEQSYSRGMANNGFIEINNDDSEEEADITWRQYRSFGRIHRVSAKGVKMDFISRVRQNRLSREQNSSRVATSNPTPAVQPRVHTLQEQQVALTLAQLSQGSGNGLDQLHRAMISEASPTIIEMMAAGDVGRIATGNLSSADTTSLEAILVQAESLSNRIRQVLLNRNKPTPEKAEGNVASEAAEPKVSPSNDAPMDGSGNTTIAEDEKPSIVGKGGIGKSDVGDSKPVADDDSAMQID
ncbi:hypothetical protein F4677DRAFT_70431 [Hypoxylon crocopeplum]|nr:hypothetical protein F4677DRAFT_70431 [Hypoxylon crocopeplum]